MQFLRIVLLTILAAIVYGEVHDQVTAHVCVEYFSIGHPRVIESQSPVDLAMIWGVVATWWVGLILGIPLAICCRAGGRPKLTAAQLIKPISVLLAGMGVLASIAGVAGYIAARHSAVQLLEPLKSDVPADARVRFLADYAAHLASYAGGFLGGIALCVWAWRQRTKVATTPLIAVAT